MANMIDTYVNSSGEELYVIETFNGRLVIEKSDIDDINDEMNIYSLDNAKIIKKDTIKERILKYNLCGA